jgi:EmrB/QacA subfamily drug resistance transporter
MVVVVVLALALLASTMNLTVGFVVLPQMTEGLGVSLTWVGWTITSYQLASSIAMSLAGRISDLVGRRRIFALALMVFALGSLGAAAAPNISVHIVMRVVAAIGGGALMPIAAAIVSLEFPHHRARALGLFTTVLPVGWIIGPTVGGLVADSISWRVSFLLAVPFAVLALAGTLAAVRESHERTAKSSIDVTGAALLAVTLGSFMLALSLFRVEAAAANIAAWVLLLSSIPIGYLFWQHEHRAEDPIVDLALLRLRPFMAANVYNVFWGAASIGSSAFIPFYAMVQFGFDSSRAGAMLVGLEVALIVSSTVVSIWFLRRMGYRLQILGGGGVLAAALLAVGIGVFAYVPDAVPPFWTLFIILTVAGAGMGAQSPASNNAGIELMPSRISSIVGLRGTFRFAGSVIATTVIFFILSGFEDAARGIEVVYLGLGVMLVAALPLVLLMPTGRESPIDEAELAPSPSPSH